MECTDTWPGYQFERVLLNRHVEITPSSQRLAWFRWSQTSRYIVGYPLLSGAYLSLIMSPAAIPIVLSDISPRNHIQHLRILWVHHFRAKTFGPGVVLYSGGNEAEPLQSPIVVYDYAVGGHTVSGVENQIKQQFMSHVGRKPEWAAWTAADTLFGEFSSTCHRTTFNLTPGSSHLDWRK